MAGESVWTRSQVSERFEGERESLESRGAVDGGIRMATDFELVVSVVVVSRSKRSTNKGILFSVRCGWKV